LSNNEHERSLENELDNVLEQVKEDLIEAGKKKGALTYKAIVEKMASFNQDPQ
jgi:RNA polymerase primary sigma factor